VHISNDPRGVVAPRGYVRLRLLPVLGLEPGDVGPDLGIGPVPLQKLLYSVPGVAEQRPVYEIDRGGGALDVQQDRCDPRQLDRVRAGM
jgi:hypothetical protein